MTSEAERLRLRKVEGGEGGGSWGGPGGGERKGRTS